MLLYKTNGTTSLLLGSMRLDMDIYILADRTMQETTSGSNIYFLKKDHTVAIYTCTNNVYTSKDKSRLILLHIITGGLITVH